MRSSPNTWVGVWGLKFWDAECRVQGFAVGSLMCRVKGVGEGMAVLGGDSLLSYSFEFIARYTHKPPNFRVSGAPQALEFIAHPGPMKSSKHCLPETRSLTPWSRNLETPNTDFEVLMLKS